jgi:hypothetical protein
MHRLRVKSPQCIGMTYMVHFGISGRFIAVTCIHHHSSTGYLLRIWNLNKLHYTAGAMWQDTQCTQVSLRGICLLWRSEWPRCRPQPENALHFKGKNIAKWILLTLCGFKFIMAAVRRTNYMCITARSTLLAETHMWSMRNWKQPYVISHMFCIESIVNFHIMRNFTKELTHTSTHPHVWMVWCLVN